MKKQRLYDYYRFGYNFNLLTKGRPGNLIGTIVEELIEVFEFLDALDLQVTKKAADRLIDFKNRLESMEPADIISKNDAEDLSELTILLESTLDAELQLRYAYILTEKRLGLKILLDKIDEMFSTDVFSNLPELAQSDFSEAGKCLAFERSTASAFHTLRGTEEVLRFYYKKIVTRNRLTNPLWKQITDQLKQRRGIPTNLIDACDHVRVNFRNPTAHPDARYGLDDAQSLYALCADLVNRMMSDLKEKDKL